MSYSEELAKRRQDPEYRAVERELRPILDLADDVFHLRMERRWTQAELARLVGTKQANISRLENGEANPTIKFLQKLSRAFNTDLAVRLRSQPAEILVQEYELDITESEEISSTTYDLPCNEWALPQFSNGVINISGIVSTEDTIDSIVLTKHTSTSEDNRGAWNESLISSKPDKLDQFMFPSLPCFDLLANQAGTDFDHERIPQ
jgi:transcriptional regulator with XRE-family HTH domain